MIILKVKSDRNTDESSDILLSFHLYVVQAAFELFAFRSSCIQLFLRLLAEGCCLDRLLGFEGLYLFGASHFRNDAVDDDDGVGAGR